MTRLINILITNIFIFFVLVSPCSAFDWMKYHTRAEEVTLEQGLKEAEALSDPIEKLYFNGLLLLTNYQNEKAENFFNRLLEFEPENFAAQWGIAEIMSRRYEYEQSRRLFEKVIEKKPDFSPAYITLAYVVYMQFSFQEAERLSAAVINMDKKSVILEDLVRAHGIYAASKGMIAKTAGAFTKTINYFSATRHMRIAKKLKPDSYTAYVAYGSYYMALPSFLGRDLERAEKLLFKAIEKNPHFPDPYLRLAQISLERGDKEAYDKYIQKAVEVDPRNPVTLDVINDTCKFICIEDPE